MECAICINTFNQKNHKMVQCHYCFFSACRECVGRFLLEKDEAVCMNCEKVWEYAFLCTQMTRTFMNNQYKEHKKTIMMRQIEPELGDYQELAVTLNQSEEMRKNLIKISNDVFSLQKQERLRIPTGVRFQDHCFNLYTEIGDHVTDSRYAAMICRYVEELVNPPPTEDDKRRAVENLKFLDQKMAHHKFVLSFSLTDRNVFYLDKMIIAMSFENEPPTKQEVEVSKEKLPELVSLLKDVEIQKSQLYKNYIENPETYTPELTATMYKYRTIYRDYWKHYFRTNPPTPKDFDLLKQEKEKYTMIVEENRRELIRTTWLKEDVYHSFNSNVKYIYNLDDCELHRINNEDSRDKEVLQILIQEEKKWEEVVASHNEKKEQYISMYETLSAEHRVLRKKLYNMRKKKTSEGRFIENCPHEGCRGKLGEDGVCGICNVSFCSECMKEKQHGGVHECQKDDVETIRELRRTTRPCPKCHVSISKIEGCDQMWCVQCHTTFSWKTGAISQGVVHNPHFYHQLQQATRTPGDIPCGGLPNEIEMTSAIARMSASSGMESSEYSIMFDVWDFCDNIAERLMPYVYNRFNNTRPIKYRRYSISYMRGKIDKKRLGSLLFKNYMDEIRYAHYYQLLETFVDNIAEYMRQFTRGINTEKECIELVRLLEGNVRDMNKTFRMNENLRFFSL